MKQKKTESKKIVSAHGKRIWQIDLTFLMVFACILVLLLMAIDPVTVLIVEGVVLAAYLIMMIWLIPAFFRSYSCIEEKDGLTVNGGILIYRRTRVRYSAVQYCVISQGYVQKAFQSCSLILMLAGSYVRIHQIALSEAKALKMKIDQYQEHHKTKTDDRREEETYGTDGQH